MRKIQIYDIMKDKARDGSRKKASSGNGHRNFFTKKYSGKNKKRVQRFHKEVIEMKLDGFV